MACPGWAAGWTTLLLNRVHGYYCGRYGDNEKTVSSKGPTHAVGNVKSKQLIGGHRAPCPWSPAVPCPTHST